MTNDTYQANTTENRHANFGARLQSARELLGLERKDAAAQLRLSEKVIDMMEKNNYPSDLPITFIRGYLRSYGKLLSIPEHEIKIAIEPIQPKPTPQEIPPAVKQSEQLTSGNYFMQLFTYLIIFTLIGLVAMWWYSHSKPQNTSVNNLAALPDSTTNMNAPIQAAANPSLVLPSRLAGNTTGTAAAVVAINTVQVTSPLTAQIPGVAQPATTVAPAPVKAAPKFAKRKVVVEEVDADDDDAQDSRPGNAQDNNNYTD